MFTLCLLGRYQKVKARLIAAYGEELVVSQKKQVGSFLLLAVATALVNQDQEFCG